MKIAVAMSGGVDSSMAALLLKEAGHEVVGLTAELSARLVTRHFSRPSPQGHTDSAGAVADAAGIPLLRVNMEEDFNALVVEPFCMSYLAGQTPNPCIRCNALIKFGRLLDHARSLGCDKIATGHYAKIGMSPGGRYYIACGAEKVKDQSYFLYMLSQESLKDIMFPLGELTKNEVRELAITRGLRAAERPESQEICFIPDNRYAEFIARATGAAPAEGDIVDTAGTVIGRHRGIHHYTIGQRRGLGIAASRPLYVVRIDAAENRIIAGNWEDLESYYLFAGSINYMKETELDGRLALVKTRSTQSPVRATLKEKNDGITVEFDEPQIGISPGQAAVFYNNDMHVLGGGLIVR
ncbi:MAG: tRNA 2-thiouridine(34) synthase MnmA [Spirochaetes bacterium]|nr:tRNA 2-thiouridine(34) synthase MnmA [Spirochaetota bacterium]